MGEETPTNQEHQQVPAVAGQAEAIDATPEQVIPYRTTPEGVDLFSYGGRIHAFDPETGVPGEGKDEAEALADFERGKALFSEHHESGQPTQPNQSAHGEGS
jgi:hypothetical protein